MALRIKSFFILLLALAGAVSYRVVAQPQTTISLVPAASAVAVGKTTTLRWTSNADSCVATGQWTGNFAGRQAQSGSQVVGPLSNRENQFTLTCTGPGGSASRTVVVRALPPPSIKLQSSAIALVPGESLTLEWSAADAATCTASGSWTGNKALSGSESLPNQTRGNKTFTLSCRGTGGSAKETVRVSVAAAPAVTFTAAATAVLSGRSTSLRWRSTDATDCTASGDWSGTKGRSGSEPIGPIVNDQYVYTLTCKGPTGEDTETVIVEKVDPPTLDLTLDKYGAKPGESVVIRWVSTDVQSCQASGAWSGAKAASGEETLSNFPTKGKRTYNLSCKGGGGSIRDSVVLEVTPPPTISFSASPAEVAEGAASSLRWSAQDASGCVASGDWSGDRGRSGSASTGPLNKIENTFTLTCTGANGSSSSSVKVKVLPPPDVQFALSAPSTTPNSSITLSWSSANATSCRASGGAWSGERTTSGSLVIPNLTPGDKKFTLTCTGSGGSTVIDRTLIVADPPKITLNSDKATVPAGGSVTLTWAVTNAESCAATGQWSGTKNSSGGSEPRGPLTRRTSDFTLTCRGRAGEEASVTRTVEVTGTPVIESFAATPTSVKAGGRSTLTWSSRGTTECAASGDWSGARPTSGSVTTDALAQGERNFTLICSGTGGSDARTVKLSVIAPSGELAPAALAFGEQAAGASSAARNVVLRNTSTVALGVSGFAFLGANATEFTQTNDCPALLNPQATCTIAVTFSPTSGGNKTASLRIASDSQSGAITLGLTGTAVAAPRIAVSVTAVDFGSQAVALASEGKTIAVKNEGNAPLAISGLTFGGAAAAQFGQTNDCPAALAIGATCTVTVRFTPADPGAKAATLAIASNAANGVANVSLAGEGASVPVAVLGATTVGFDRVAVGSTGVVRTVQLRNAGGAALTLTAAAFRLVGADAASFSQTNDCPESLAPNAVCTITLRFAPATFGAKSATLSVASNAPSGAVSASLAGTGTQAVLSVSTESLDFSDQVISIMSSTRAVTLTNSGNVAATLSPVVLAGEDAAAYALTSTCGATLVEGQSCTVNLTFTPATLGGKSAVLKITGDGISKDVFVSGFGVNDRKSSDSIGSTGPITGGAFVWTPPGRISKQGLPGGVRLFRNRTGSNAATTSNEPRVFKIDPNGNAEEITFRDRDGKIITQDTLKIQSVTDLENFQIIKVRDTAGQAAEYLIVKSTGAAYLTEGLEWNSPKLLANGSIVARKGSQLFVVDTTKLAANSTEALRGRFVPSVDSVSEFEVSEADDFIVYAGSTSAGTGASTGVCRIYDLKAAAEVAFNNVSRFVPGANDSGGWGTCLWMRNPVTGQLLFPDSTKKSVDKAVYVPIVRRADGTLGIGDPQTFTCSFKLSESNGGRLSTTAAQFPDEQCKHTNSGIAFRKRGRWVGDQHFFGTDSKFVSQVDFEARKIVWRDDLNATICAGCADEPNNDDDNWWLQSAATPGFVWMAGKDRNDRYIVARLDPAVGGSNAVRTITFNDVEVGEIRPISDDTVLFKGRQLNPLANVAGTAVIQGDVLVRSKTYEDVEPEEFDIRLVVDPQSVFRQTRFKATAKVTGESSGQITPASIDVVAGRQGSFQITLPSRAGVGIVRVTGCNGSLNGLVYTTGPMTRDCDVVAEFGASTAAPKQIALTASELIFDTQVVGVASSIQTFSLLNTGTAALTVSAIGATGAQAADFPVTHNCPASVVAGASCSISVRFSPTAAGERNAAITITSDAASGAQNIRLTGFALPTTLGEQAATAAVSADALKSARPTLTSGVYWFDPDGTGGQAAFQAYADLSTAGGGWLQVRRVPGTGNWYSQNDNLLGTAALNPSASTNRLASTEWSLAFAPYVDANTEFLFATGNGDTWCVIRRGTSVFDGQVSLTTRASQVIASSNTAIGAGGFTNVLARAANAEDPWIGCQGDHAANTARMLYGENGSPPYTAFKNSANGINVLARKLRVTANGVTLSPAAVSFGTVNVNSTSSPQVLTLTNTSTAAVELKRIFVAGVDSAQFQVTHNCGTSIAAQASCAVTVRLSPLSAGGRSATLVVDAAALRLSAALTATGRAARLVLSSNAPATGVKSGESVTLTWESAGVTSCSASGDWSGTKSVNGSERSGVLVGNAAATNRIFRIECAQDGGGTLTSSVTVPVAPALEIAPATIVFGEQANATVSSARTVVVTNRSAVSFGAPVVSLDGVDAAMFSQTSNCPNLLAPGQSCAIAVAFRPNAAGARAARVVVSGRLTTDGRLGEGQVTSPSTQRFFADNGHIYEFVTSGASWTQARAFAESRRLSGNPGYLATITTDAEMAFIKKAYTDGILKGDSIWLGASDVAAEGQWRWVTGPDAGATVAGNLWVANEPNNSGDEDYGALGYFGRGMNDLQDRENAPWISGYLVEYSGGAAVEGSVPVTGTGLAGALSGDTAQTAVSTAAQLKSLRPTAPSGLYWFDPDGAGGNPAFRTYADLNTAGGGWMQVRRVPGTSNWYPANDDLLGTSALNAADSEKINHTGAWSLKFDYFVDADTEYLFAAGNGAAWCVLRRGTNNFGASPTETVTGSRVVASSGTRIAAGGLTNVLVRPGSNDDPWIGCEGDHQSNRARTLYGDSGNANNLTFKNANNGINVFVRKAVGARLGSINGGLSLSDTNSGRILCNTAVGSQSSCSGGVSAVLRNLGSQALPRPQFSVRGADAAAFAISPNCGATIEPGTDCSVSVVFNPLRAGRHSAELVWDGVAPSDQWGTAAVINRSSALNGIKGVALDSVGNIYFSEYLNGVIRKIDARTGAVSPLISGLPGVNGLAFDSQNRLYAAVGSAHVVVRIDVNTGNFVVVAGTANDPGNSGDGGPASQATLTDPTNVLVDRLGRLFITQDKGGRLRMVEPNGTIYTVTETGVAEGLALDSRGNVYFGDNSGHRIRRISGTVPTAGSDLPFSITTVAGTGSLGSTGDGGDATAASLSFPQALYIDDFDRLFFFSAGRIREVDLTTGKIRSIAGSGSTSGTAGEGGAALGATIGRSFGIAGDGEGTLYVTDYASNRLLRISPPENVPLTGIAAGCYATNDGGFDCYVGGLSMRLINPVVTANGRLYYHWDVDGDGRTVTGADWERQKSDAVNHRLLDGLMNAGIDTVDTQDAGAAAGIDDARTRLVNEFTLVLPTAAELQAIYRDTSLTRPPGGWSNFHYWASTLASGASSNSHVNVFLGTERGGTINSGGGDYDAAGAIVAFQMLSSSPPTLSLSSSSTNVAAGATVQLSWTTTNSSICRAEGAWTGVRARTGTETSADLTAGDKTFTLTCDGPGGRVARSVKVTVAAPTQTTLLAPTTVAFGELAVGAVSAVRTVTYRNITSSTVSISGITILGADATHFTLINDCPTSLAAGATCNIQIGFQPTAAGLKTGTLRVNSTTTAAVATASVSGTADANALSPVPYVSRLSVANITNPATQVYWSVNGHIYERVPDSVVWNEGRTRASQRKLGNVTGYLATVTTLAEANFLSGSSGFGGGNRGSTAGLLLGASDNATEGDWRWVTGPDAGEPVRTELWNKVNGEPNNAGGENFAHFWDNGLLNDINGTSAYPYLVEYGGDPVKELEDGVGASRPVVVALDNGRTIVSYKRGIDVCSASFDPRTCIERSATWHMVIDANGVIVPPQQTAEVIDANAAHNNATRGPSSGAKFGDGFNAVIGLGNSGQNTAGGNAVVIGGDGGVRRLLGGTGAYASEVCSIGADTIISSLYTDPVTNKANWFPGTDSNAGEINFGSYGYNYTASQDLACGENSSLGRFAVIADGGPGVSWRLRHYGVINLTWTQRGEGVRLATRNASAVPSGIGHGIAVGGTKGVALYRDLDAEGRSQIYYARFNLSTAGLSLVDSAGVLLAPDAVRFEGLSANVIYSGGGDDFFIALYQAGRSATGQPANTQQAVRLLRLNHATGAVSNVATPSILSGWVAGNSLRDVSLTSSGYSVANNEHINLALSCDGNVYVAATVREGSERGSLKVYRFRVGQDQCKAATPRAVLSTNSIAFGTQAVGTTSLTRALTLRNEGEAPLQIRKFNLSGAASTDFDVIASCPSQLAPGASCQVNVAFKPASAGAKTGAIGLDSDSTVTVGSVDLTGTGGAVAVGDGPSNAVASVEALRTARPTALSGLYWFDPDGSGGNAAFQAYADLSTAGGSWLMVRRIPATGGWYSQNDDLRGLAERNISSAAGATSRTSTVEWSLKFDYFVDEGTEYLFATGDGSTWCVLRRGSNNFDGIVNAPSGSEVRNTPVLASQGTAVAAGGLTNVLARANSEDPWIGCEGGHTANTGRMLYGESGITLYTDFKNARGGINVFVRKLKGSTSSLGRLTATPASVDFGTVNADAQSPVSVVELRNNSDTELRLSAIAVDQIATVDVGSVVNATTDPSGTMPAGRSAVQISLPKGTYVINPVMGRFSAFQAAGPSSQFMVCYDFVTSENATRQRGNTCARTFATQAEAVAAANSTSLTLNSDGWVRFFLYDTFIDDNPANQGVTLSISRGLQPGSGAISSVPGLSLNRPHITTYDSAGNLFISDTYNRRVIRVGTGGQVSVFASLNGPYAMGSAFDSAGNFYVSDYAGILKFSSTGTPLGLVSGLPNVRALAFDRQDNLYALMLDSRVRRLSVAASAVGANNTGTVIAGTGSNGYSGDDGPATSAQMNVQFSVGLALDAAGNIYVADRINHRIRRISTNGTISTFAGTGTAGFAGDGGPATAARLNQPSGLAFDRFGNLYVADGVNYRIRRITPEGLISTVAGTGDGGSGGDGGNSLAATLSSGIGIQEPDVFRDTLVFADHDASVVRRIALSSTALAEGYAESPFTIVSNDCPRPIDGRGLAPNATCKVGVRFRPTSAGGKSGALRVASTSLAETFNVPLVGAGAAQLNLNVLRTPTAGTISTIAGGGAGADGVAATSSSLSSPFDAAVDSAGNLYIVDATANRVRKVDAVTGQISTIAGNGNRGFSGDGGPGPSASLNQPTAVAVDSAGNVFIADTNNFRIRRVAASTGVITTVAGTNNNANSGDGGPAVAASLAQPLGIAVDASGNLYIASGVLRKITASTGVITSLVKGFGYAGDGGRAADALVSAQGKVVLDADGNLFFAEEATARIRRIDKQGNISTYAGNGTRGYSGDNGPATAASLNVGYGLSLDAAGNLYLTDTNNNRVRRVDRATGIITTVVGSGDPGPGLFAGDGGPANASRLNAPVGTFVDPAGNVFVADQRNSRVRIAHCIASPSASQSADCLGAGDKFYAGQRVQVTWSVPGATSCTASGAWSGAKAASGSEWVGPLTEGNREFKLSCSFSGGATQNTTTTVTVLPATKLLVASDTTVAFGSQDISASSSARTVTLRNAGSVTLTINSFAGSGDATQFKVLQSCGQTPVTLRPGATCPLSITFAPTTSGAKTVNLTVNSDAGTLPITVTGTGVGSTASWAPMGLVAASGLESTTGASRPHLAAFGDGKTLVAYRRGLDRCTSTFGPTNCSESSQSWHMVIDGNGVVASPRQTSASLDTNASINNGTRMPTSAARLTDASTAVVGFGHSGHNSAGGNAAVIGSDGVLKRMIGGTGSYESRACTIGSDAVVSSLYVDPIINRANYFSGALTRRDPQIDFGGYGTNYPSRQDIACGENATLGKYAVVGNGGPGVNWRLRYYKINSETSWQQLGAEARVTTSSVNSWRSTAPLGIAVGGNKGVSIYRDQDTDGRAQIYFVRFTLGSSGVQLIDTVGTKISLSLSSYEGLSASVAYSGSGDDFYIALYQGGTAATGQPANTQQAVTLIRLNHATRTLSALAGPYVASGWVGTNNLGDTQGVQNAYVDSQTSLTVSCDGNVYVAAALREGSERRTLRVFKHRVSTANTCSSNNSGPREITQSFNSDSKRYDLWDYNGRVAAQGWSYTPYKVFDKTLGTLTAVKINTTITGTRDDASREIAIRQAFFTGWSPADYQFYEGFALPAGSTSINYNKEITITDAAALAKWTTSLYVGADGLGNNYFEAVGYGAGFTLGRRTTLTFVYQPTTGGAALELSGAANDPSWMTVTVQSSESAATSPPPLALTMGAVGTTSSSDIAGVTPAMTSGAVQSSTEDADSSTRYVLVSRSVDSSREWRLEQRDALDRITASKALPQTSDVLWRGTGSLARSLPTSGWVARCGEQVLTVQDGYSLLLGGNDRALTRGWTGEVALTGRPEAVVVSGVQCLSQGLRVMGWVFPVDAQNPRLTGTSSDGQAFSLVVDASGEVLSRQLRSEAISIEQHCSRATTETSGFCTSWRSARAQ